MSNGRLSFLWDRWSRTTVKTFSLDDLAAVLAVVVFIDPPPKQKIKKKFRKTTLLFLLGLAKTKCWSNGTVA